MHLISLRIVVIYVNSNRITIYVNISMILYDSKWISEKSNASYLFVI